MSRYYGRKVISHNQQKVEDDAALKKMIEERHSETKEVQIFDVSAQTDRILFDRVQTAFAKYWIFKLRPSFSNSASLSVPFCKLPVR